MNEGDNDVIEPFSITKAKVIYLPVLYLHGDSQSSVNAHICSPQNVGGGCIFRKEINECWQASCGFL